MKWGEDKKENGGQIPNQNSNPTRNDNYRIDGQASSRFGGIIPKEYQNCVPHPDLRVMNDQEQFANRLENGPAYRQMGSPTGDLLLSRL